MKIVSNYFFFFLLSQINCFNLYNFGKIVPRATSQVSLMKTQLRLLSTFKIKYYYSFINLDNAPRQLSAGLHTF